MGPILPTASGFPGFNASFQKVSSPMDSMTDLTKSASPTDTPPDVIMRSDSSCALMMATTAHVVTRWSDRPKENVLIGSLYIFLENYCISTLGHSGSGKYANGFRFLDSFRGGPSGETGVDDA